MDLEQKLETVREKLDTAVEKAADRAEEAAEQLSQEVFTEQVRVRREKLAALQEGLKVRVILQPWERQRW